MRGRYQAMCRWMAETPWIVGWRWFFLVHSLWFFALTWDAGPALRAAGFLSFATSVAVALEALVIPLGLWIVTRRSRAGNRGVIETYLSIYPKVFLFAGIASYALIVGLDLLGAAGLRSDLVKATPSLGDWLLSGRAQGHFTLLGALVFLALRSLLLWTVSACAPSPEAAQVARRSQTLADAALLWVIWLPFLLHFFYGKEGVEDRDTIPILGVAFLVCEAYSLAAVSKGSAWGGAVGFKVDAWLRTWLLASILVYGVGFLSQGVGALAGAKATWRLAPAVAARLYSDSYVFDWRVLANVAAYALARVALAAVLLRRNSAVASSSR